MFSFLPLDFVTSGCACDFCEKPVKYIQTNSLVVKPESVSKEFLLKLSKGFNETWGIPEE